MAKKTARQTFFSRLQRLRYQSRNRSTSATTQGFTLIELMVVTLIAAGIVVGLTYMVVELLQADQRESSLTETQRDMQMALDYINDEMQQAVYIYSGECLIGNGAAGGEPCHGLYEYLPEALTDGSVPIVAFWKQEPYPEAIRNNVCNGNAAVDGVACINASSYALVVYSLQEDEAGDIWDGSARITRYALTEFDEAGNTNAGYVNPGQYGNNFAIWPWGSDADSGAPQNLQDSRPAGNNIVVLSDFVDDGSGGQALGLSATAPACPDNPSIADPEFALSPTFAAFSAVFPGVPMSFYACVGSGTAIGAGGTYMPGSIIGENGETILYLRGNAAGRPGVRNNQGLQQGDRSERGLPTIQTRVLSRSVLTKDPETQ